MRRLVAFCLASLLVVGLVMGYLAYTSRTPVKPQPNQQATPEQCQADAYSTPPAGAIRYRNGDLVTNVEHAFSCKEAGWCNQGPYSPGVPFNGQEIWRDAWTDLGACPTGPQVNSLELSFSTVTGTVPFKTTVKGVGPQPQRNLQVSGVLRCKAQAIPFSGPSDQPLVLSDLPPCKYDVFVNETQGYLPLNTPVQVEFTAGTPEQIKLEVKFRHPWSLDRLVTLPGVKVEMFASGLYQPRQMAMGNKVLYVGSSSIPVYTYEDRTAGFIYAIPLDDAGRPTGIHILASGLEEPHGVAYRDGDLYFSTVGKLYRVRDVDNHYLDAHPEVVMEFPPDDRAFPLKSVIDRLWHQKHPLHFNPLDLTDKGLYTAVGMPCNTCMIPDDPRYGTVLRYDLETRASTILARGVRNSVGFAWDKSGRLWFSDNNRQGYLNSDEINVINQDAEHFGVPYFYGRDVPGFTADEYQEPNKIVPPLAPGMIVSDRPLHQLKPDDYSPPAYELGSNTAPLGVAFWKGFHDDPGNAERLIVAVHGTGTNVSPGMELRMLTIRDGKVVNQMPLVTGFGNLLGKSNAYCLGDLCLGRPADMLELADHSLLVTDDLAGTIYRITFDMSLVQGKSVLLLSPADAPTSAALPAMFSGTLLDPQGIKRRFDMAWGRSSMMVLGLTEGVYTVTLNNVGTLIPKVRQQQVKLNGSGDVGNVNLAYIERPPFGPVKATLVAPDKPATGSGATDEWEVTLRSGDDKQIVKVPWGGSRDVQLPLGEHAFNFPYYVDELPDPTQQVVLVDEDNNAPVTISMQYRHTPELGKHVVSTTCATCHTTQFFQDANKAINWSLAGRDALVHQILGMTVKGHCDASCSGQIADYFYSDLWAAYLDPTHAYGKRQLRLLTRDEYVNSVRDLFAVSIEADELPANKFERPFKYPGEADLGIIQADDLKTLYDVAWKVAKAAVGKPEGNRSVEELGRLVFRRPLTSDERGRYERLRGEHDQASLVAAMLLSPHFLYRFELGVASGKGASYPLTANERATALSYTLLGTTPSNELMRQAEQGQLETPAQIGAVAEQLLKSPQGAVQFNRFISYYLKTDRGSQAKPGLSEDVVKSMQAEQAALVGQVIADGGSFEALFNPGFTFVDKGLARHYGLAEPAGNGMQRVQVDDKRGGLLHLGITQAANSDYEATSLVKRGIMIREQLLCREFGAPVDADPVEPQYPPRAISTRERWDLVNGAQASGGRCWQCHQYMNDTGSSMEHYDAAGRYRDQEQAYNHTQYPVNVPINAAGPFISNTASEEWGPVNGVRDIASLLPGNGTAQTCMADSYFRFMFGNKVSAGSVGALKAASQALKDNGSLIQMIRELATSPVFLNRHEEN